MTDPDALQQAEQRIAQLTQQLDAIQYSLSHDLRTPVMTIVGFADLLISDLPTARQPGPASQYLEHIRSSATRQAVLLDKLLELLQLATQPLHMQTVHIGELCTQVWQGFASELRERIDFQVQAMPATRGDAALLTILLQALLDNAIKFTRQVSEPQIRFSINRDQHTTWYALYDNGVGFDKAQRHRLFKPFQRLHASKDFTGVGMGLAMAQCIVHRHSGVIEAQVLPEGGCCVRFTLSGD